MSNAVYFKKVPEKLPLLVQWIPIRIKNQILRVQALHT